MAVAYPINRAEREAVANFLGTKAEESPLPASAFCSANISILSGPASDTWAGWSPSASNARYQTAERAGLAPGQVRRLKLKWALGFPGDVTAFAAPTVVNGTLFVGSASGAVEAVDAKTGCTHWVFQANGPVRAAILPVPNGSATSLVLTDLIGWAYALEAKSGHLIWKKRIDEHEAARLTGSSVALNGVVFIPAASWEETRSLDPQYACCTFRGSVTALRVRDGSVVWKTYTVDAPQKTGTNSAGSAQWGPSGAPIWSAPTVDTKRGLLYVATGDNYSVPATSTSDAVMALDLKTGRIVWTAAGARERCLYVRLPDERRQLPAARTGRISILVRRPFWFAPRTARKFWWRDKNPAWSTRLTRTQREKFSGRRASEKAA